MRQYIVTAAALAAVAAAASPAAAVEKCFDKATLSYVDCPGYEAAAPIPPAPLPPVPPIQPWSGFYIGAHGGYAFGEIEAATGLGPNSEDIDGALAGGHAGFLRQYDNDLVLGLEIDGSAVFAEDNVETRDAALNWLASARLRAGVAVDQFMPYVTGGVALADWEYDEPGVALDETTFGLVAGGGVELLMDENWMLRAEGLYYFLDDDQDVPGGEVGPEDVIVGRGGLTYKF